MRGSGRKVLQMETLEILHSGEIYDPGLPEILKVQQACLDKLAQYNALKPSNLEGRERMLKEMLAECGEGCYIEIPFHANFGGRHVHLGDKVYMNFGCTLVDDTHIYIGSYTLFGPNVVVATAAHPLDPEQRKKGLQYNKPVHIGENCWIGAGALIMPGVSIGDNSVIGAGSVVTRDIPAGVVAVGNPCRVVKELQQTP